MLHDGNLPSGHQQLQPCLWLSAEMLTLTVKNNFLCDLPSPPAICHVK